MRTPTILAVSTSVLLGAVALGLSTVQSCSSSVPDSVVAKQIRSRADLIGGPGALGEVGDYLLANEKIRVIIQDEGFSRGFGLYGGSLIDADLVRPQTQGNSAGGQGRDNFGELFPGLFLKAMKPTGIEAVRNADGSASVIVRGRPADFVFLAQKINEVLVNSENLFFKNEYRLYPGRSYIEIITTVTNQGETDVRLPDPAISQLIEEGEFIFPVGDVVLFGAGNQVFSEGAGFDVRFTLEDLYEVPVALPQLPGLLTRFLATRGDGVSYGFMSAMDDPNLSLIDRTGYDAQTNDLLVPFLASAFTGAYYGAAPSVLGAFDRQAAAAGAECSAQALCEEGLNCVENRCVPHAFSFKKYFIVGNGDVAAIRDVAHEIRELPSGSFGGVVRERFSRAPEAGVDVLTFDAQGEPYNHHTTDALGNFVGQYEPGEYTYRVLADGRTPSPPQPFTVVEGEKTFAEIELESPGMVSIRIVGEDGRLLPARCSLIGTYDAPFPGMEGRDFLYDLAMGERIRPLDLVVDTDDPLTRRYIEEVIVAPTGIHTQLVRPGEYRAVCSRGMEYELYEQDIVVQPRQQVHIDGMLKRAFSTLGWASGDYHLHSRNSLDSFMAVEDRVSHVAAEGVDIAVSTDHNFVTDYEPTIARLGIQDWLQSMVGLEMTTLEVGHFNGYPLRYNPGPITKGAFEWSGRPPAEIFADMRALGSLGPDDMIIQVNHPRDTILGYFNDYNVNPDTGEPQDGDSLLLTPEGPEFGKEKFDESYDVIEVFNGKRFDLLHTYRVPEVLPEPPLPDNIPPAGTVLRDSEGQVAFPGAMEDWFVLMNRGVFKTATGASDTHGDEDEPGIPRTYVPVSDDRPGAIEELEVVQAMKRGRAMVTNGPFMLLNVRGQGCFDPRNVDQALPRESCEIGDLVAARDGKVEVTVQTRTAPWVQIDTLDLIVNGEVVSSVNGDRETLSQVTQELELQRDGWLIARVTGTDSMFPVIVPREIPSIQVSDALGSIGSSFGIDFAPFGNLMPTQRTIVYSYAFTNPVIIDVDGAVSQFDAPGVMSQALRAEQPRCSAKKPDARGLPAILKIFTLFNCGHGH